MKKKIAQKLVYKKKLTKCFGKVRTGGTGRERAEGDRSDGKREILDYACSINLFFLFFWEGRGLQFLVGLKGLSVVCVSYYPTPLAFFASLFTCRFLLQTLKPRLG